MSGFRELFGRDPLATASAPGRVNLLGEHTDYNEGFVLPLAIAQTATVQLAPSPDRVNRFHSEQLGRCSEFEEGREPKQGFARYLSGCVAIMREHGWTIPPLLARIDSGVPMGEGLSSSAALEVAFLRALRELLHTALDDVTLALCAQTAEIRYAGVRCGIMDQMASSLGDPDRMLFLDTRTLERELLPLPAGTGIVVIGGGAPRELAASGYNRRREECAAAAQLLGVAALRDIADPAHAAGLESPLDRRARHVISENARVLSVRKTCDAQTLGSLMNASHASLRDDYEVSVPALDELVALLQSQPAVHGAKLSGAGFGGACVALVSGSDAAKAITDVMAAYLPTHPGARVLVPAAVRFATCMDRVDDLIEQARW